MQIYLILIKNVNILNTSIYFLEVQLSFELATPPLVFDQVWEAILVATKLCAARDQTVHSHTPIPGMNILYIVSEVPALSMPPFSCS